MILSILVPIYNEASFIERCVRSLMEQTMTESIEFVFIDDASTDSSLSILRSVVASYPNRKNQVQIFCHTVNQGISFSRREAILAAKGKYIGWCDSDDWCEPNMFMSMCQKAEQEQADIVSCGYECENESFSTRVLRTYPLVGKEYLASLYTYPNTFCSLCDKIVKRSLLLDNDILPFSDVNVSEDMNVMFRVFYYAQRICTLPFYYYHVNCTQHHSITHSLPHEETFRNDFQNNKLICEFLENKELGRYRLSCSYLKFLTKIVSSSVFESRKEYYHLYQETHRDILRFTGMPLSLRIKYALIFSTYFAYCLYSRFWSRRKTE